MSAKCYTALVTPFVTDTAINDIKYREKYADGWVESVINFLLRQSIAGQEFRIMTHNCDILPG